MPPSARSHKRRRKAEKPRPRSLSRLSIIFVLFLLLACILNWFIRPGRWNGKTLFTVAVSQKSGEVDLLIVDPRTASLTILTIPANTQVAVAHQLGSWKIESVYALGEQEGLGGQLLADTVMKSFKFPIDAWAGSGGERLYDQHPLHALQVILFPPATNLNFKDRFRLAKFALKVQKGSLIKINLAESGYLEPTRLTTGEDGYLIKKTIPVTLARLFSAPEFSQATLRLSIKNSSGSSQVAADLARILETMGIKVTSIQDKDPLPADCLLIGQKTPATQKISQIFRCPLETPDQSVSESDIILTLGSSFAQRF